MSESIEPPMPDPCPTCGAALSDAAGGLCPRCLMADAANATDVPRTEAGNGSPSLEEVMAAFPQFEIVEFIGHGGMGTVWNARQPTLNRHVALKLLPASLAERDPAFAERFAREGQLLARLHHPNIVAVHDSGRAGDFFYIVMEFVDGVNLRQAMRASRFTPQQALAIVPKICDALQYAHDEGVLHRDIKPENILLDAKGRVKLVDFGIAKLVAQPEPAPSGAAAPVAAGSALTLGDATLGTPNYMAPEQIDKPADVDNRADIYSLGVVFYELLTGELPVGKFAPPSERSAADPRLDGIVRQALEKERDRRQQSVGEMRTQVETISGASQASVPAEGFEPPRFSRLAIVAACWVGLGLLAAIWLKMIEGQHVGLWRSMTGPEKLGFVLTEALFVTGFMSILGTTILGWIAVSKIRRSAGRVHGLGLAVFDGLLFPLLALDVMIWEVASRALIQFSNWQAHAISERVTRSASDPGKTFDLINQLDAHHWLQNVEWDLFRFVMLAVVVLVDWLIIRAVWRAVNNRSPHGGATPPVGASGEAMPSLRPTIILHAVLFALVALAFLVGVPQYMRILIEMRVSEVHATLPALTRMIVEIGRIWGLLIFPLMLGVDVACCFLARQLWGQRGLRLWSATVVINLVLFVAIAAVSLWLPMRENFVQLTPETAQASAFGPVIDLLVKEAVDLDTGKVASLPESVTNKVNIAETVLDAVAWMEREGMDAFADTRTHFFGVGMRALAQDKSQWDQLTAPQVVAILDASITKVSTYVPLEPLEGSATFVIQTREGGRGLLQILGSNEDGVKIRYKLVRHGNAGARSAEESPAKRERVLYFPADRSLGQIFIGPARRDHDTAQIWDDWQRFSEARGKVEIPEGKEVRLDVSAEGIKDLSPLAALRPDDLQALILKGNPTDECLKHVGKFSGLRYLSMNNSDEVTDAGIAHCAGLRELISLNASGIKITDQSLKVIGRLPRLEELQLGQTGVTDQGLAELAGLTFLQSLGLDQTAITDHAWTPLLHFRELRYLDVAGTGITGADLEELGKLPKLESLDLGRTAVADQSLPALKKITGLKTLVLSETEVTDAGLAALSDMKTLEEVVLPSRITDEGIRRLNGLPSLRRLELSDTAAAGKCLGRLDHLPSLRSLTLGSEIEDADLENLKNFPKLEELWLEGPITDKGLQSLVLLKSLKILMVQNSKVTDAGFSVLEKLPALEEFLSLDIGDEGLRHVGNVSTLKILNLSFNPHITDRGISYLERLSALEQLYLDDTHVQGEGLSALRKIRTLKRVNMLHTELSPTGVDTLATLTSVEEFGLLGIKIAPRDLLRLQALIPASRMDLSLAPDKVPPKSLKAGDMAPDFSVQTLDGKTFRLADQRGKTVLLHFWAMWCAPCVACTPDLKKFEAELRAANPNFTMLSLDMDEMDARVRTHVTKHGLDWPQAVIGYENKMTNDFGVAGAPTYFVIGPDGRIVSLSRDWKEIRDAVSTAGGGTKSKPE